MSAKKNTKKIVFYDTDHSHAELKVRLKQDGISQSEFFRSVMTGYIIKKGNETMDKLGLAETEIENIFDLLEKANPDL